MRKAKKLLAVVLAVSMLCSVLAFVSSAATVAPTYAPANTTGALKLVASAKVGGTTTTSVVADDVVAVSFAINGGSTYTNGFSVFGNIILYNDTQLTPCDSTGTPSTAANAFRIWQNDAVNFCKPTSAIAASVAMTKINTNLTSAEQGYYNHAINIGAVADSDNGITNADRWDASLGEYVTCYFKVSSSVLPGDTIKVGMHEAAFLANMSYFYYNGTRIMVANISEYDFSQSMVELTVASPATMEVNPIANALSSYGQIRYKTNAAGTAMGDTFDVRLGSTISQVNEVYANEAEFAADIVDVGFVFSASAMSAADAATVAEGGTVSGLTKKALDDQYLQRITAGETYKFFCFIKDIPVAEVDSTVYAYAYVQTTNNGYFYYPAVISVTYSTLYNAYIDQFKADMGIA